MAVCAYWTDEEIESLITMIEGRLPLPELARRLDRTREEIETEAFQLAISLSLENSSMSEPALAALAA